MIRYSVQLVQIGTLTVSGNINVNAHDTADAALQAARRVHPSIARTHMFAVHNRADQAMQRYSYNQDTNTVTVA